MQIHRSTLLLAGGIGLVAGLRSMAAPAILSRRLSSLRRWRGAKGAAKLLRSRTATTLLPILAAGEMAADKTPVVPDRIEPPSIMGRAASGALCGAAIASWAGDSEAMGAAVGAAGALASTFAAYHLRVAAGEALPVPQAVIGLAEDALALIAGSRIASAVN